MTDLIEEPLPRYVIRPLTRSEGGGYLIEFPDYPGCIADGETLESVLSEGVDAIKSYMLTMRDIHGS